MGDDDGPDLDLDRATALAWRHFGERLAEHLASMDEDDSVVVSVETADEEPDDVGPYVQFAGWGEGMIRFEVSSNHYLTGSHRLDAREEAMLLDLGLQPPSAGEDGGSASFNHHRDCAPDELERAAEDAGRVLRDVFGVPHPSFLNLAPPLARSTGDFDEGETVDLDTPVFPDSPEHLRRLVDAALATTLESPPTYDEDGDIPVASGSALVFVRTLEDAPIVRLLSVVARGVQDPVQAAIELTILNRGSSFIRYSLIGEDVMAFVDIPARPFVARHLLDLLSMAAETIDAVDDDLAFRLRAQRWSDLQGAEGRRPRYRRATEDRDDDEPDDDG